MTLADGAPDTAAALRCEMAGEVLRSFGSLRFVATGWSMLPAVWPGDTLFVDRISPERVRVGDVVLVGREGRLCAHRVVCVPVPVDSGIIQHWITRGDAMAAPDRPVGESELLGRVSYLIREGKLVAVGAGLSVVERLLAGIVRRSVPAARALVYLRGRVETPKESVVTCQG
jgi:signal peptidase I